MDRHNHKALEDEDGALMTLDASVPPGRDVRCIISVAMLSEGWDATTVTHVVGLLVGDNYPGRSTTTILAG